MRVVKETKLSNFEAWSGAVETQERIIKERKEKQFDQLIEELYPDGLTDTELNDILWFEEDWIFDMIGIRDEDETEED